MSTPRTKPYEVRKVRNLHGPAQWFAVAQRFVTEPEAIAYAEQISADQGGTEWLVQGPTGTHTIRHGH